MYGGKFMRRAAMTAVASVLFAARVWYVVARFQWRAVGTALSAAKISWLIMATVLVPPYRIIRTIRWHRDEEYSPIGFEVLARMQADHFWTWNDDLAGHQHRYSKPDFAALAEATGFQLLDCVGTQAEDALRP